MLATRGKGTAPFINILTSSNQDLSWRNTIASHRDLEQHIELAKQSVTNFPNLEFISLPAKQMSSQWNSIKKVSYLLWCYSIDSRVLFLYYIATALRVYGAPFVPKLGKMVWYIKEDGGIYTPMGVYIPHWEYIYVGWDIIIYSNGNIYNPLGVYKCWLGYIYPTGSIYNSFMPVYVGSYIHQSIYMLVGIYNPLHGSI